MPGRGSKARKVTFSWVRTRRSISACWSEERDHDSWRTIGTCGSAAAIAPTMSTPWLGMGLTSRATSPVGMCSIGATRTTDGTSAAG